MNKSRPSLNFHILTLFPEMISAGLGSSIIARAVQKGLLSVDVINFREFTNEKHGHVDDAPFGGGAGMVLMCQPIYDAWKAVCSAIQKEYADDAAPQIAAPSPKVIYTSPAGRMFDQDMAAELAKQRDIIILCGHYEGVDQRILELIGADEVSIGDYVLTGGELPAMVMVDAISRMVPGVLGNAQSGQDESFGKIYPHREFTKKIRKQVYGELLNKTGKPEGEDYIRLLEYPQYTRPEEFMGLKVPQVLLSGDHARVDAWRREQSVQRTRKRRPDLLNE